MYMIYICTHAYTWKRYPPKRTSMNHPCILIPKRVAATWVFVPRQEMQNEPPVGSRRCERQGLNPTCRSGSFGFVGLVGWPPKCLKTKKRGVFFVTFGSNCHVLGGLLIFDTRHVKLIVFGAPVCSFLGESSCGSVVVFFSVVVWRISWCLRALLEKSGLQHSVECSCKSWRHQCSRWGGVVTVKAGGLAEGWECSEWKPECKRGIHKDLEWIMNKSMIWTYSLIISSQKKSCTEACSKPKSYIPSRQLRISGLNPRKRIAIESFMTKFVPANWWPRWPYRHLLFMSWSSQRKTLRGTRLHARRQMQALSWKHSHWNNDGFCNKIGIPLWLHSSKIREN